MRRAGAGAAMTARPRLSRPQLARAVKAKRVAVRTKLGQLRDRRITDRTATRYRKHVAHFFSWMHRHGYKVPSGIIAFDLLLCNFAEALWSEGDSKSTLGNTLSGLGHFVDHLRGKLPGAWRLYNSWVRSEPPAQAPPFTLVMTQAMAGYMTRHGHPRAALMTIVCFHCILRTGEMLEVRTTDIVNIGRRIQLQLRDTKIGQRLNITEDVMILDPWLVDACRRTLPMCLPGATVVGMSPAAYRRLWAAGCEALGLPREFQPYGLRRGGATCWFQHTGSFSKTADRGRWSSERGMKQYITCALAEISAESFDGQQLFREYAQLLNAL